MSTRKECQLTLADAVGVLILSGGARGGVQALGTSASRKIAGIADSAALISAVLAVGSAGCEERNTRITKRRVRKLESTTHGNVRQAANCIRM